MNTAASEPTAAPATTPATAWYDLTPEPVAQKLQVDPAKGLSAAEAAQRLQQHGPNRRTAKKKESGFQAFVRQYQDFMQIILLGAAVGSDAAVFISHPPLDAPSGS